MGVEMKMQMEMVQSGVHSIAVIAVEQNAIEYQWRTACYLQAVEFSHLAIDSDI